MKALLEKHYKGMTVKEAIYKWAPPHENDSAAYVRYVCQHVGCTPATIIDDLLEFEE